MSVATDRDIDAVLDECRAVVRERRSSTHPFVAELDLVSPSRRALGRWAVAKYHQVYLQNVIFSALHLNAQDREDIRQYAMRQLVAEETGITSGSAPHYTLMRRFATACGATEAELDLSQVAEAVRSYVDALVAACRDQHVVYGLLTVYSIESQSGESAARVLRWLRANHDFTDDDLEWFIVHAEDEDDHADDGLALIRRYAPELPDFAEQAPVVSAHICDAWLTLHDYYRERLHESGTVAP